MVEFIATQQPKLTLGQYASLGFDSAYRPVTIFGYNADIDGANRETVWSSGGTHAFPTTGGGYPKSVEIDSSSADDAAAGSGAQSVRIEYLNSSFEEKTKTLAPVGTTDTACAIADFYRLNNVVVMSGAAAAGIIQIRETDDSPVFGAIEVGQLRSRDARYTVPLGKRFIVDSLFVSTAAATTAAAYGLFTVYANFDQYLGTKQTLDMPQFSTSAQNTGYTFVPAFPFSFPAGVDIHVDVVGDGATSNMAAYCELRGYLVPV